MVYTDEQRKLINEAKDWYRHSSEQVFQYSGGPGRGKSVVMNAIISELGLPLERVAPMSYMGAAAIVMKTKGLYNARTIHSWLLSPIDDYKTDHSGNIIYDHYLNRPETDVRFIPKDLKDKDLIAIDEGETTPYKLKYLIESQKVKVLVCGDLDQLPPIEDKPAYLTSGKVHRLTIPMRQVASSGKFYIAERARQGLPIHNGFYGDALVIYDDELTDEMIMNSDVVICGRNSTREKFTNRIRRDILHISSDLPVIGERVACSKNNWNIEIENGINLANGLIGTVVNNPDISGFDSKTYKMDFKPNMLNSYFSNLVCDYDYLIAPYSQKQYFKNRKYAIGEKMEFAYAITCHKALGSQFYSGIYIEEYLDKSIQRNLHYTGITRFSGFLIYVKHRRKFY